MSSGPCVAMELVAEDAIAKWRLLLGRLHSYIETSMSPNNIHIFYHNTQTKRELHYRKLRAPDTL